MKYTFLKPHVFENETFEYIELRENLTTKDYIIVEREFRSANPGYFEPIELSGTWCAYMLARAADKPFEFFEQLWEPDFIKVKGQFTNFLAALTSGN